MPITVHQVEYVGHRFLSDAISAQQQVGSQNHLVQRLPYCLLEHRLASSPCRTLVPLIEHILFFSSPKLSVVVDAVTASSSARVVEAHEVSFLFPELELLTSNICHAICRNSDGIPDQAIFRSSAGQEIGIDIERKIGSCWMMSLPESTDPPRSLALPDNTLANFSLRLSVRRDLALVKPLICGTSCETDE